MKMMKSICSFTEKRMMSKTGLGKMELSKSGLDKMELSKLDKMELSKLDKMELSKTGLDKMTMGKTVLDRLKQCGTMTTTCGAMISSGVARRMTGMILHKFYTYIITQISGEMFVQIL